MNKASYRILLLLVLFLFPLSVRDTFAQLYFKADFPEFVPAGKSFEISVLFKARLKEKPLSFFVLTDFNSALKYAGIKSDSSMNSLNFTENDSLNLPGRVFEITLNDTNYFTGGICQLFLGVEPRGMRSSEISIYYSDTGSEEYMTRSGINKIISKSVDFYSPYSVAGKALLLKDKASLELKEIFESSSSSNFGIGFWLKTNLRNQEFFKIANSLTSNTLLNLAVSNYGYITSDNLLDAVVEDECFAGINSWNHIFIYYNKTDERFYLICNDTLNISFNVEDRFSPEDLVIEFLSANDQSETHIENLRLWEFSDDVNNILAQKHFSIISIRNATLKTSLRFESKSKLNSEKITSSGVQFTESDAPVFSKAPVLNVSLFDNITHIEIKVNNVTGINTLSVEKSYDGNNFFEIQQIGNLNPSQNVYSITEFDNTDNQIIFYRVKQVNENDEIIYSSSAKVGRGKQAHFEVDQNYPNPFNPATMISVNVKRGAEFEVLVYDVVGKLVTKLHEGYLSEGLHQFEFIADDLPSGIYFAEVKSEEELLVMKMILAK